MDNTFYTVEVDNKFCKKSAVSIKLIVDKLIEIVETECEKWGTVETYQ